MEKSRTPVLFLLLALSFQVMEGILRLAASLPVLSQGLLVAGLSSLTVSALACLLATLLPVRVRRVFLAAFLLTGAVLFGTQLVYRNLTGSFYAVFSALHVRFTVSELQSFSGGLLAENALWVALLLAVPAAGAAWMGRLPGPSRYTGRQRTVLLGLFLGCHLAGYAALLPGAGERNAAWDLYFVREHPLYSVERLGLLTAMRVDWQRNVLGWSWAPPGWATDTEPPVPETSFGEPDPPPAGYQTLKIPFAALLEEETDPQIARMHRYFQSRPAARKHEMTGILAGYHVVMITAEAFAPYGIREELTPTLYRLQEEGVRFEDFYTPLWGVSTLDGEYVACTGLLPKSGVWSLHLSSRNHLPFVLGNQLRQQGYRTLAFHNHTYTYYNRHHSHPNMGYEYYGIGNGLAVQEIWPASDHEMFRVSVPQYIGQEPFHAYYMTMSGHLPYTLSGNNMARRHRDAVAHLPYSEEARAYLATQIELDLALGHLMEELEAAGILEQTLIVLSSDHYPYGLPTEAIGELRGEPVRSPLDLQRNTMLLYAASLDPVTITDPVSSLDILPTVSSLLGLEYDSRLLMGRDIFSDTDPLVVFRDGSFRTAKGSYDAATRRFQPRDGVTVDPDYLERMIGSIDDMFFYSARVLETDYYRRILPPAAPGGPQDKGE